MVEAVVAHNVAGKTGVACQSVIVFFGTTHTGTSYLYAVRHENAIGHMRFGRSIENSDIDAIVDNVEYGGNEGAGLPSDSFSGFEVDFDIVFCSESLDESDKFFSMTIRLSPRLAEAYKGLGKVNMMQEDYQSAMKNFKKGLMRDC